MAFPSLSVPRDRDSAAGRKRVCIATADVAGPYPCGGVGAAYEGLALALARGGHDVTLLYVSDTVRRGTREEWEAHFAARGVRFVHLPQPPTGPIWYGRCKEAAVDCERWLAAAGSFDVIHFHEWLGLAYYTLVAKRLGLGYGDTTICIGTHGPMRWSRDGEERLTALREDLIVDFMERRCVALANVVVSPSRYMLAWMDADGWCLPERTYVAQNVLRTPPAAAARARTERVRELVFFGRLDRRKGLGLFCNIVDRLTAGGRSDFAVTFLGSAVHLDGKPSDEYVRARSARWPCPTRVVTDHDRNQAFAYLGVPGRLAVMPAQLDNLPCTVQECLQIGLPFLASSVGGTAELIDPADRAAVLCAPDADRFAARLATILAEGQGRARPAVDRDETERTWIAWHRALPAAAAPRPPARQPSAPAAAPTVSVCIAHFERPQMLAQMLASLVRQTAHDFEVIVCDDGSTTPATIGYLDALGPELAARGWTLIRTANRGPGPARHSAAERARGAYLLFFDDDDWAEPDAVATLIACARHAGVDALVSFYRSFTGTDAPHEHTPVRRWFLPLGPALGPSLISPEAGGAMLLIAKDVYFACGGFATARDVDEDWELLVTLIERGYDLEVVPRPLFWYRDQEVSRSRADNRFARTRSRVRLFERMLPRELRDFAALALAKLAGAADSESLRRLERVRQVLDKREQRRPGTPPT